MQSQSFQIPRNAVVSTYTIYVYINNLYTLLSQCIYEYYINLKIPREHFSKTRNKVCLRTAVTICLL